MAWLNITLISNYEPRFFEIMIPSSQMTEFVMLLLALNGGLQILSIVLIVIGVMKMKKESQNES